MFFQQQKRFPLLAVSSKHYARLFKGTGNMAPK